MDSMTAKGGAVPATGEDRRASLDRTAGDAMAKAALANKTRSSYNSSGSSNYCWIDVPGEGWGGSVRRD